MYLKSLRLEGFEGIGRPGISLTDLGDFVVCIGANNVGKSSVFRFLHMLRNIWLEPITNGKYPWEHYLKDHGDKLFWLCDLNVPFTAELEISCVPIDFGRFGGASPFADDGTGSAESDNQRHMKIQVRGEWIRELGHPILHTIPSFLFQGQWLPSKKWTDEGVKMLGNGGRYHTATNELDAVLKTAGSAFRSWMTKLRFLDSVRTLNKAARFSAISNPMDDGSELITEIRSLEQDRKASSKYIKFKAQALHLVNTLLDGEGIVPVKDFSVKGTLEEGLALELVIGRLSVPIESMGSGIAELFMTCCWLALEDGIDRHYFLEEPENHLHPALLRRYMQLLRGQSNLRLVINTHSSAILNSLESKDRIWLFQWNSETGTGARSCTEFTSMHCVLDALGINGASLLQANCAIWVEGPSDRIYVRRWLNQYALQEGHPKLMEGSDYTFVFYGGKILSHFSLNTSLESTENAEASETIAMLHVSRYSAVLMDKDELGELSEAKQSILKDAEIDKVHRWAKLTKGREVENDVDPRAFREALLAVIGDRNIPALTGAKRFPDEITDHRGLDAKASKALKSKLHKAKVRLATLAELPSLRELIERGDGEVQAVLPEYVASLFDFIVSSRADSKKRRA